MIQKAEIYSNHRLIAKVKIYQQNNKNIITVVPRNRNEFIFFYPDEKLSIHHLDEVGDVFIYHVLFEEIKMIRTNIYYQFQILHTDSYRNLKNDVRKKTYYHALLSDFKTHQQVKIFDLSDKGMKIESPLPLEIGYVEIFYYIGKKKLCCLGEISIDRKEKGSYFYGFFIHRKEVI